MKSVRLMGVGVYGGKYIWKKMFLIQNERLSITTVMYDDSEDDESEEDKLRQG